MEDASSPRRIVPSIAASASAPDHRFSVNGLDSRTREEAQQPQQLEVETRRDASPSQSRISDCIEIPHDGVSVNAVSTVAEVDAEIRSDQKRADVENAQRKKRNAKTRRGRFQRPGPGPGLKWHCPYSALNPQAGRVLIIEYERGDTSHSHIRKVAAQEIFNLEDLRRYYRSMRMSTGGFKIDDDNNNNKEDNHDDSKLSTPAMRLIHVQNADWAVPFLMHKFNISDRPGHGHSSGSGSSSIPEFGRYLRYKNPELRGGKPLLAGKTWQVQYDPWRGVKKTSFGLDYMKSFRRRFGRGNARRGNARGGRRDRMMQLNDFDENDEPVCEHDVYVQRLSCYIQHKQTSSENKKWLAREDLPQKSHFYPPDVDLDVDVDGNDDGESNGLMVNLDKVNLPNDKPGHQNYKGHRRLRRLMDNGNAIIVFDNSSSENIDDTLIPARRDLECRWRRLPFHLAFEDHDLFLEHVNDDDDEDEDEEDDKLALSCSKAIINDIFKSVVATWDIFLDQAYTHMTILEDKIYERPDDESRAPELWANSNAWLKVEKLVNVHASVVRDMKTRLHELTDDIDSEDNWLEDIPGDFERLTNLVAEDLTKPTESVISLLYQSVSIRDSRHSLELGVSMWRLSWITFIFLPLTFMVGFFGMNVDTFSKDPSIKWYFAAAIPFMFGVLMFYFFMKGGGGGSSNTRHNSPRERLVYETFCREMADQNPTLWSRAGPRFHVRVDGSVVTRVKWWLIKYWLRPVDLVGSTTSAGVVVVGSTAGRPQEERSSDDETISDGVRTALIGGGDGLSTLSKIQRYLSRRWTTQLVRHANPVTTDTEMGLINMNDDDDDNYLDEGDDMAFTGSGDARLLTDNNSRSIGEGLAEVAAMPGGVGRPKSWTSAPSSLDDGGRDGDDQQQQQPARYMDNPHLTVPTTGGRQGFSALTSPDAHGDRVNSSEDSSAINTREVVDSITVTAAGATRDTTQSRLRSNSSPSPSGRGGGRGASSGSSRGDGSRSSDRVIVEEEDAAWLNERGRQGQDWVWRSGSSGD